MQNFVIQLSLTLLFARQIDVGWLLCFFFRFIFFAFGLTLDGSRFLCLWLPLRIECVWIRYKSIRILIWFWWNILWLSREMNTSLMAMFGTFRFDQQFIWRIWGLSIAVVFQTQKCVRLSILLRSLSFPILFDKNNKRWHFGKIQPSMVGEQSDRQSEKIWSFFFLLCGTFLCTEYTSLRSTPDFSSFFLLYLNFSLIEIWSCFNFDRIEYI